MDKSNQLTRTLSMGRIISVYSANEIANTFDEVKTWSVCPGGAAAHVSIALSRLGSPSSFIGCVGNDDVGICLKKTLEKHGVDVQGVRIVSDTQTGWIWSVRLPDGGRTLHSPQLSFEHFADSQLSSFDIDPVWFEKGVFFVPQTIVLGPERSREGAYYAKELVEKAQGTTFFDMNFRRYDWQTRTEAIEQTTRFAKTCQVVQISVKDCKMFFGVEKVIQLAPLLPKARGLLLTKGAAGCEYLLDGNIGSVPGVPVTVVDSSLGGDAFLAAFISRVAQFGMDSLADSAACQDYIRFANTAGAFVVGKQRDLTSLPEIGQLEQILAAAH